MGNQIPRDPHIKFIGTQPVCRQWDDPPPNCIFCNKKEYIHYNNVNDNTTVKHLGACKGRELIEWWRIEHDCLINKMTLQEFQDFNSIPAHNHDERKLFIRNLELENRTKEEYDYYSNYKEFINSNEPMSPLKKISISIFVSSFIMLTYLLNEEKFYHYLKQTNKTFEKESTEPKYTETTNLC